MAKILQFPKKAEKVNKITISVDDIENKDTITKETTGQKIERLRLALEHVNTMNNKKKLQQTIKTITKE